MFRVCSAAEMRQSDKDCTEKAGIPGIVLMENAARGCVDEILKDFPEIENKKVAILCGRGNNGGDGLAIARLLSRRGTTVTVFLTHGDKYSGDAAINREIISHMNCSICHSGDDIDTQLNAYDIIVDAIFGTGIHGTVDDDAYKIIKAVNSSGKYVLSVDIPSGIAADTGEICGICINATKTATFAAYKKGLLLFPGCDYTGEIIVCDICTPENLLSGINKFCIDDKFVQNVLPGRKNNSQKGDYGKVLIIGGSVGMTGAPAMSANAAMKAGAGLVTVGICESLNPVLEVKLTEAMTYPLCSADGHLSRNCINQLEMLMKKADSILFGPGLGTSEDIASILEYVMKNCTVPLIIDADGLNVLSKNMDFIQHCNCSLIFTPHEVEMSRLCGEKTSEVMENRLSISESFAQEYGVTLILKGHHTIVTASDGTQYINITGNPGMATGGSGDVLAGIVAAFAAQGIREEKAAAAAVYIHGLSGDISKEKLGEASLTATDIINSLPETFKKICKR